ncbi:TonB-dependent receptor plug domain-containing protein [Paracoccus xiamenensis]|uniref:TonB-dependent receptor plug domain-containing protein n=1 Tax=Paracoccus xiamenensis TaxID=2714901 RepID=UPI00140D3164|nr:TonB-dependent receptor plug domain-containing protein [Paracoccus xiamenensis]NHF74959.1 TonB-dependent receptor plug domain-containing protein [Paracoccus xiamenensis]
MTRTPLRIFVIASAITSPGLLGAQEAITQLPTLYLQADRRDEELKDQPRAVTVLTDANLQASPTEPGAGIALHSPGLTFSGFGQPGTDFLNIRGVGPLGYPLSATDHIVAFSVNEVPTSGFGFPPAMLDMDQVEVFRGPQGTVFGRNALGGGINFVPRAADGVRERRFVIEAGTDGYRVGDFVAGGWLVEDRLAGRIALRFQDFDGDIPNTIAGGTEGGASLSAARLSLTAYTDSGWDISAMLQGDRSKRHSSYLLYYEHPDFPESGDDFIPENSRENRQFILKAGKDFDGMRFTLSTAA